MCRLEQVQERKVEEKWNLLQLWHYRLLYDIMRLKKQHWKNKLKGSLCM
jgi:hypothetical protein